MPEPLGIYKSFPSQTKVGKHVVRQMQEVLWHLRGSEYEEHMIDPLSFCFQINLVFVGLFLYFQPLTHLH